MNDTKKDVQITTDSRKLQRREKKEKKEKQEVKVVKLYNEERKNLFLNSGYPENTQKIYKRIFVKSSPLEERLNKDLCDFSKAELEDVLYDLNPLTPEVSQSNGRIITAYIQYCVDHKISNTHINILRTVEGDWFDRFVDKTKKLYFTENEIRRYEDWCENAQDAVVIRLLFEGVGGKENIEIRNLRREDVDLFNETITLREGLIDGQQSVRVLHANDRTLRLIQSAYKETTYQKRNGYMAEVENVRKFTDLIDNNYIVRGSSLGGKNKDTEGPVQPSVVYRRIAMISEVYGIPYFTTKNIFRSGVIHMGYKILLEKKEKNEKIELTSQDYIRIADHFNIQNYYTIKNYCNVEMIEELYGKKELYGKTK